MATHATDYAANLTDSGVLKLNPRTELRPEEITSVFGYPRNLKDKVSCSGLTGPSPTPPQLHGPSLGGCCMACVILPACSPRTRMSPAEPSCTHACAVLPREDAGSWILRCGA